MALKPAKKIGVATTSLRESLGPGLDHALRGYDGPAFTLRFWDDSVWQCSRNGQGALFEVWLRNDDGVRATLLNPNDLAFAQAFVNGDVYLQGDLFETARAWPRLVECLTQSQMLGRVHLNSFLSHSVDSYDRFVQSGRKHSKARDKAGAAIFEQSPAFFHRFLGESMLYSCGLFGDRSPDLGVAQLRKMEMVCSKLELRANSRYLDIGCGWGALPLYAAQRFSTLSHGITLSCAQANFASEQAHKAGLSSCCQIDQRDYRDLDVIHLPFERISSIGVTESVGGGNVDFYFASVTNTLAPGGLLLNESLTKCSASVYPFEQAIDHLAMPDRELLSLSTLILAAEGAGFEVRDVEDLREHYVRTFRCWLDQLEANEEECVMIAGKHIVRAWKLFAATTAAALDRGELSAYQMLLSKSDQGASSASKTRFGWYEN